MAFEVSAAAAPRPRIGACAESRANRIQEYVLDRRLEVLVVAYRPRLESSLEEMPDAAVAFIEAGCVRPVQSLHADGELWLAALDDDVKVITHEAIDVHRPIEVRRDLDKDRDELPPIIVVDEDQAAVDTARGHVVDAVRVRRAVRS